MTGEPLRNNVLVTGGSGGIGRATCLAFARQGWNVGVHYFTRRAEAERTVDLIAGLPSTKARTYQADIRVNLEVQAMVELFVKECRSLDVLVCNAGVATSQLVLRHQPHEWQRVIDTNLTGTFHCVQAVGGRMIEAGGGAIVVVGSYAGMHGSLGQAAYATAKAGLLGLVRSVAREWGPLNVRVNIVYPGWQRTDMTGNALPPSSIRDQHCLDRPPDLDEVARTIYHIAQSQDLSGQVWNLDSRLG